MKNALRSLFFLIAFFASSRLVLSQTNPSLHNLAHSNYSFTEWASNATAGTYPANMIFHYVGSEQSTSFTTNGTSDFNCAYDLNSRPRFNGQGTSGFSFVNTGDSQYNNCSSGTALNRFTGAAVLGLNASGRVSIKVTWTGRTIDVNNSQREYKIALQYKIGNGSWNNLPTPNEYLFDNVNPGTIAGVKNNVSGNSETFTNIELPSSCNNQPELFLRWIYFNVSGSNTRPVLGVDDITVSSVSGSCNAEGFDNGTTPPTGWVFTAIGGTYTSATNFGVSSPSLQFDNTNDRVETPTQSGNVVSLSFWLKGQSTNAVSALLVEGYNGSSWVTIENITNSIPTTGTTKMYNASSTPALPSGMQKFRFTYTKSSGNLAFDDVQICTESPPNSISTGTVSSSNFTMSNCASTATGTVDYTITGTFNSGNIFTAELSDVNGNFSQPLAIGTRTATDAGTINITIPENLPTGTGYKIRVLASNPATTGSESSAFTITQNGEYCPTIGDYRTKGTNTWATVSIWETYNYDTATKTRAWQNASVQPNNAAINVYVRNTHTVTLSDGPKSINNLIVDAGGRLYRNNATCGGFNYINLGGDILCNGNIGNGTTSDAIGFNIQAGNHTIKGSGSFDAWRIRLSDEDNNGAVRGSATLIIDMNVNLRWNPSVCSGAGANAIYSNRSATANFDVTINAGKTLTITQSNASFGMDGANAAPTVYPGTERGGGYNVFGTIDCSGHYMLGSNNSSAKPYLTIKNGGLVKTGYLDFGDNNGTLGGTLTIEDGGKLEITNADVSNNTWLQTNTGSISFSVASGSTVEYSRAGHQNIPALFNYHHLIFSGSGNKTFSNTATIVNGNFTLNNSVAVSASTSGSTLDLAGNLNMNNTASWSTNAYDRLDVRTTGNGAQTYTGNGNPIRCYNFRSDKTGTGSLTLAANTPVDAKNNFRIKHNGSNGQFSDGGNTITVGDDVILTGIAARFDFTGTINMTGISTNNDIKDESDAVVLAELNNLTISGNANAFVFPVAGNQNLIVKGNVLLQSGSLNNQNNIMQVRGNWNNTGGTFIHNNQKVIFNGNSNATINGGGLTANKSFYDIEINKSSGTVEVNSAGNTKADNLIDIKNGILNINTNHTFESLKVKLNDSNSKLNIKSNAAMYVNP
jgi:hypothetical protein